MRLLTAVTSFVLAVACGPLPEPSGTGGGSSAGGGAAGGTAGGTAGTAGGTAGTAGGTAGTAGGTAGTAGGTAGTAGGAAGGAAAQTIPITFSTTCATLAGCVSDPLGTWRYTGACIDPTNPYPAIHQACASVTYSNLAGTARGTVVVGPTSTARDTVTHITGDANVPASCATLVGGCAGVANVLRATLSTVTCTGASACTCTFTDDDSTHTTAPSTLSGSTFTIDPGTASARTFSFCRTGATLRYHETSETAVYTMEP